MHFFTECKTYSSFESFKHHILYDFMSGKVRFCMWHNMIKAILLMLAVFVLKSFNPVFSIHLIIKFKKLYNQLFTIEKHYMQTLHIW